MQVVASVFVGPGCVGDFGWMIEQPEYARYLFVFNDNEEEFRAHRSHEGDWGRCEFGGGNAIVRPHQCTPTPRAVGIPTGSMGLGYVGLTDHAAAIIDEAIGAIAALNKSGRYTTLIYSSDGVGGLGTGIFDVAGDVKRYIVGELERFSQPDPKADSTAP
jgi:hypothetical protein